MDYFFDDKMTLKNPSSELGRFLGGMG